MFDLQFSNDTVAAQGDRAPQDSPFSIANRFAYMHKGTKVDPMKISRWIAVNVLEQIGHGLWGFKPNLMRHIVEQHGAVNSIFWFVRNMPTYENTLKQWGPIRTHLLAAGISVLNGCPYCTYGHAYALQLHYFKKYGRLLPIDENEMVAWHRLAEADGVAHFRSLIQATDLAEEGPIFERMLVLRQGSEHAGSKDDRKVMHLISMFGYLNRCGINGGTKPDQAHDPISKERSLRDTYHHLRAEATSSHP